jgi:hypothetical protein
MFATRTDLCPGGIAGLVWASAAFAQHRPTRKALSM